MFVFTWHALEAIDIEFEKEDTNFLFSMFDLTTLVLS